MASLRRCALATVTVAALSLGSGCTLAKPIVGAFTGPVVMLGHANGGFGCYSGDGRAIVVLFAVMAAVGAGGGLVTGIVSDINVLTGNAPDPCANWWDPFATNRGG